MNINLFIHEGDSEIGTEKYTGLCQAIQISRKLIILLNNSYLANSACLNEANLLAGKTGNPTLNIKQSLK